MSLDLSLLQNIDFINKDNLIFLSILLVIAIIFIVIFWWTVSELIKTTKRAIIRVLNIDSKPKFDKKNSTDWLHKIKENNSEKKFSSGPIINFFSGTVKTKDKNEVVNKSFGEKEKTDIAEGLSKLKAESILGGGIESKMPARTDGEGDNQNKEIKIPVPVHGSSQPGFVIEQNNGSVESGQIALPHRTNKDGGSGSLMFGDKTEISRVNLRHALRYDPEAYKAQKEAGLYNMNRTEREELEKEVFAPVYGRNISKSDLNRGIKKLGTKMRSENNPEAHAKLRKEIKFFKKIGGIK